MSSGMIAIILTITALTTLTIMLLYGVYRLKEVKYMPQLPKDVINDTIITLEYALHQLEEGNYSEAQTAVSDCIDTLQEKILLFEAPPPPSPPIYSLFDHSHILEEFPVDARIELQCEMCKARFETRNCYYVGYSGVFYVTPSQKCIHGLKHLKPTGRRV